MLAAKQLMLIQELLSRSEDESISGKELSNQNWRVFGSSGRENEANRIAVHTTNVAIRVHVTVQLRTLQSGMGRSQTAIHLRGSVRIQTHVYLLSPPLIMSFVSRSWLSVVKRLATMITQFGTRDPSCISLYQCDNWSFREESQCARSMAQGNKL